VSFKGVQMEFQRLFDEGREDGAWCAAFHKVEQEKLVQRHIVATKRLNDVPINASYSVKTSERSCGRAHSNPKAQYKQHTVIKSGTKTFKGS
jgi:hypothetical protein